MGAPAQIQGAESNNTKGLTAMFHKIDYPFLIAAFLSFVASVSLWFLVDHDYGLFVGIWVPSILALWVGVRVVLLAAELNQEEEE